MQCFVAEYACLLKLSLFNRMLHDMVCKVGDLRVAHNYLAFLHKLVDVFVVFCSGFQTGFSSHLIQNQRTTSEVSRISLPIEMGCICHNRSGNASETTSMTKAQATPSMKQ